MKNKLLECIDTLTLFGFQITFAPFDSFRFKIELRKGEHINGCKLKNVREHATHIVSTDSKACF